MNVTTSDAMTSRVLAVKEGSLIPGLLFRFTGEQLTDHCRGRIAYHNRRAEEKRNEIPQMEKAIEDMRESIQKIKGFRAEGAAAAPSPSFGKGAANRGYGFEPDDEVGNLEKQIENLKADIRAHENKAAAFQLIAGAFFSGPTPYALQWDDLVRLEIVPQS